MGQAASFASIVCDVGGNDRGESFPSEAPRLGRLRSTPSQLGPLRAINVTIGDQPCVAV